MGLAPRGWFLFCRIRIARRCRYRHNAGDWLAVARSLCGVTEDCLGRRSPTNAPSTMQRISSEATPIMTVATRTSTPDGMARIEGGTFRMGSDVHYPEERPAHSATVDRFWIDRHTVTNADFAEFAAASGYVTFAERPLDPALYPGARPELLTPGSAVFRMPNRPVRPRDMRDWWEYVPTRGLAASGRARQHHRRAGTRTCRACRVRGRRHLRRMGRQGSADGSRMGVRRTRRAGWRGVLLGRRVHT